MGGGGGNDFQARQDQIDHGKQQARNALNVLFGVAPTAGTSVDPSQFTTTSPGVYGGSDEAPSSTTSFDQAGYNAAIANNADQAAQAATNKTARDAIYAGVRNDAFNAGKRKFDESKTTAGRDLKFELFARGLNGGSVDVDQNALLGRKYSEGITDLGAKADAASTGLRNSDEQTRLGLLGAIDSGTDQGSAISSALAQLQNNSSAAAATAQGTSVGDLFNNAGLLYDQGRRARGEQSASALFSNYRQPSYGGSRATSGGILSTTGR